LLEQGDMLKVVDGEHPLLLTKTMQKVVNLETLCILNDILNFLPMWKEKISDEYVWPTYCKLIEKYTPFIRYDKVKFKKILKEKIKENAET
jgi:hypothetical protein